MSIKHLSKGSLCPQLYNGILRLYNMKFCPYAQRTLLVLKAKGIKYEIVNVNLKNKPDWFLAKTPLGKVPVLEQDDKIIYESLVTCDFLEENFPSPPLYPSDPWAKAADKCLIEIFEDKVIRKLHKIFFTNDASLAPVVISGLQIFEDELNKRGTKYFRGNTPGMVDYIIWPWFERLSVINSMALNDLEISALTQFPRLAKYKEEMMKENPIADTLISTEQHMKFYQTLLEGNPDYDMELKSAL